MSMSMSLLALVAGRLTSRALQPAHPIDPPGTDPAVSLLQRNVATARGLAKVFLHDHAAFDVFAEVASHETRAAMDYRQPGCPRTRQPVTSRPRPPCTRLRPCHVG